MTGWFDCIRRWSWFVYLLCFIAPYGQSQDSDTDLIRGYNSIMLRSFSDRVFSGTDVRRDVDNDRWLFYNYLSIQRLHIYQNDDWRVFASGSAWMRQDLGDQPGHSYDRIDLSYGAIQIDKGRTTDGFLKLGRIYNYRGILHQRFDGGEFFYPLGDYFDIDVYGGRRPYEQYEGGDNGWLTGGRFGARYDNRSTLGLSWLLAKTDDQWDDQKIGGDWRIMPTNWLEVYGEWGYDQIADAIYDVETGSRIAITPKLDFRFVYEHIIPGLYIPKSSIFSVYSLAEEDSYTTQFVYRPNRHWTLMVDGIYIDYSNEGGMGGPYNFFTQENALDGGYQWRYGFEIAFRYNPDDEISFRYEQLLEADYGYTATDLIRTDFDFRDYNIFNLSPTDEGFVFGKLENGFSSIGFHHWHRWTPQFTHSINFYYYLYDSPLYLHQTGDDSFSTNVTLNYKWNRTWDSSIGGRYLSSLADQDETQFYLRVTFHF